MVGHNDSGEEAFEESDVEFDDREKFELKIPILITTGVYCLAVLLPAALDVWYINTSWAFFAISFVMSLGPSLIIYNYLVENSWLFIACVAFSVIGCFKIDSLALSPRKTIKVGAERFWRSHRVDRVRRFEDNGTTSYYVRTLNGDDLKISEQINDAWRPGDQFEYTLQFGLLGNRHVSKVRWIPKKKR